MYSVKRIHDTIIRVRIRTTARFDERFELGNVVTIINVIICCSVSRAVVGRTRERRNTTGENNIYVADRIFSIGRRREDHGVETIKKKKKMLMF